MMCIIWNDMYFNRDIGSFRKCFSGMFNGKFGVFILENYIV